MITGRNRWAWHDQILETPESFLFLAWEAQLSGEDDGYD
jgi:hypothetical protein